MALRYHARPDKTAACVDGVIHKKCGISKARCALSYIGFLISNFQS